MFIVLALFTLVSSLLAVNLLASAMATSSNGGSGGAFSSTTGKTSSTSNSQSSKGSAVILIPVNTGDPVLDKQINKFYSCISKTHLDPPTKDQLDSCYYQNVSGQSSNGQSSVSYTQLQSQKLSKSTIQSSPPGMLVEVP